MEELKQRLIDLANSGLDFATQQLPEVADEYLMFKTWEHGLLTVGGLVCLVCFVFVISWLLKKPLDYWDENAAQCGFRVALAIVLVFAGCAWFFQNALLFIKVIIAPRVYIIETLVQ